MFAAAGLFNTPDGAASEESSEVAEVAAAAGRFLARLAAGWSEEVATPYPAHYFLTTCMGTSTALRRCASTVRKVPYFKSEYTARR